MRIEQKRVREINYGPKKMWQPDVKQRVTCEVARA